MAQRGTLAYKIRHSLTHPWRIIPAIVRTAKNAYINFTSRDQLVAHRRLIEVFASNNPNAAMGSDTEENWLSAGKLQFDYLLEHGVKPHHRVLEIGCGNLRLGWHLIHYLSPAKYVGIDISSQMLAHARRRIAQFNLQQKTPFLFLTEDVDYTFLPERSFDWIIAYAVFVNSSVESIALVIAAVAPLLAEGGYFDFTYYETDGAPYCFQGAYYYHNRESIASIVEKTGLHSEWLGMSWDARQMRVRLTRKAI